VSWFRSSRRRRQEEHAPQAGAGQTADVGAAVVEAPPRAELEQRPLADLHALARDRGVARFRLLRREQLIEALAPGTAPPGEAAVPERELEPPAEPDKSPASEPEPPAEPRSGPAVRVEEASEIFGGLSTAVEQLVQQLSDSATRPTVAALGEIVESPATRLLVARSGDGTIVGMLTLAMFRIPTGVRAWVEDVVVEEHARGQGVAEALMQEALRIAERGGARTVDLTSRRQRGSANRLYKKLGFRRRETNVFRFELGDGERPS
jgi:ribosomal protein S18 acetylase RimI-like enzyme